ncbi:MAG: hypothetical protein MI723_01360 [Caulobacterales bacterium]|nr:hypothetical protein [Caulobacterales bacterium]
MPARGRVLNASVAMGRGAPGNGGADLLAPLMLIWSNVRAILANIGAPADNIVRITRCLRYASYAERHAEARVIALGGRRMPTTAIVVQTLEVVAAA